MTPLRRLRVQDHQVGVLPVPSEPTLSYRPGKKPGGVGGQGRDDVLDRQPVDEGRRRLESARSRVSVEPRDRAALHQPGDPLADLDLHTSR